MQLLVVFGAHSPGYNILSDLSGEPGAVRLESETSLDESCRILPNLAACYQRCSEVTRTGMRSICGSCVTTSTASIGRAATPPPSSGPRKRKFAAGRAAAHQRTVSLYRTAASQTDTHTSLLMHIYLYIYSAKHHLVTLPCAHVSSRRQMARSPPTTPLDQVASGRQHGKLWEFHTPSILFLLKTVRPTPCCLLRSMCPSSWPKVRLVPRRAANRFAMRYTLQR